MREIKFRAWDTDNKEWVSTSSVGWNYVFERSETSYGNGQKVYVLDNGYAPEVVLMQYTGLKDINDIEIYEGDIIVITRNSDLTNYTSRVVFFDGAFVFYEKDGIDCNLSAVAYEQAKEINNTGSHFCQVIGNIYEKKELLD